MSRIEQTLCELVDEMSCRYHLVVPTTGGTGPARRDVTPDALWCRVPGFGEQMRRVSLHFVPTAISRRVGVIRKQALILNLPGQPKAIQNAGVKDAEGKVLVNGSTKCTVLCSCWRPISRASRVGGDKLRTHVARLYPECDAF